MSDRTETIKLVPKRSGGSVPAAFHSGSGVSLTRTDRTATVAADVADRLVESDAPVEYAGEDETVPPIDKGGDILGIHPDSDGADQADTAAESEAITSDDVLPEPDQDAAHSDESDAQNTSRPDPATAADGRDEQDEADVEESGDVIDPFNYTVSEMENKVEEIDSVDRLDAIADKEGSPDQDGRKGIHRAVDERRMAIENGSGA